MGAEHLPLPRAQALHDGPALLGAQRGVGVHRGHQHRRVLVVGRLFAGHAAHVDEDVAGEGDVVGIVDQHRLARQVAALALVDFKVQFPEPEKADLLQRLRLFAAGVPEAAHLVRVRRPIARQRLADADVGPVQRVLLPEARLAGVFQREARPGLFAGEHLVEQGQQAAVVHVRVGDEDALRHAVPIRQDAAEDRLHLLPVERVSAVDEQRLAAALQDGGVAAAGRLDQRDLRLLRHGVLRDPRREGLAPAVRQQLGEAADALEGLVGRQPLFVQHLHHQVAVHQQRLPAVLRQAHGAHQPGDEGAIEDAVVVHPLGVVVVDHPHRAQRLHPAQKRAQPLLVLHEQAHLEGLVVRAVLLGADIGDVQAELVDQPQHRRDAAGLVPQVEFQQHDAAFVPRAVQVADLRQLRVRPAQLLLGALGVDEQRVGVHGLVVADAGDVHAQLRKALAGLQEGADVVGHGGDVGLLHGISSRGIESFAARPPRRTGGRRGTRGSRCSPFPDERVDPGHGLLQRPHVGDDVPRLQGVVGPFGQMERYALLPAGGGDGPRVRPGVGGAVEGDGAAPDIWKCVRQRREQHVLHRQALLQRVAGRHDRADALADEQHVAPRGPVHVRQHFHGLLPGDFEARAQLVPVAPHLLREARVGHGPHVMARRPRQLRRVVQKGLVAVIADARKQHRQLLVSHLHPPCVL